MGISIYNVTRLQPRYQPDEDSAVMAEHTYRLLEAAATILGVVYGPQEVDSSGVRFEHFGP